MYPSPEEPDPPSTVVLARYQNLAEAELVCSVLQGSGVAAKVRDAQVAGLNWHYGIALGGIRVEVPESQLEEAQAIVESLVEVEESEEEMAELESARDERRSLGKVALGMAILPLLAPVVMGVTLISSLFRRGDSSGEEKDAPGDTNGPAAPDDEPSP